MRILVVAATAAEIAPFVGRCRAVSPANRRLTVYTCGGHDVDVLVTGVGMVATAAWCSHALARADYQLALNLGLCGSFDPALGPGTVVHVVLDRLAELGAEDGGDFLPIEALGLQEPDDEPYGRAELRNEVPPDNSVLDRLPRVAGITVNTVHGHEPSIRAVAARYRPQVESMEGAAFMYACMMQGIAFAQVRAVSNTVARRNRAAWRIEEAVAALCATGMSIVESS